MRMLLHMLVIRDYFRTKVTSSLRACFNALGYVLKLQYMLHLRNLKFVVNIVKLGINLELESKRQLSAFHHNIMSY